MRKRDTETKDMKYRAWEQSLPRREADTYCIVNRISYCALPSGS